MTFKEFVTKGGQSKSPAKQRAARRNWKKAVAALKRKRKQEQKARSK